MPSISDQKESQIHETPVLLFDCQFADGHQEAWSTHRITVNGTNYRAAVLAHNAFDLRSLSEDAIDASARLNLTLANADSYYSQLESIRGTKGARLTVRFLFYDLVNDAPASEVSTLFRGIANAPESITESQFRVSFNNRLSLQRTLLPNVRMQKRCPWTFPSNQSQRIEAISGGSRGQFSAFFRCGYSASESGGSGTSDAGSAGPFTSCDYTRSSCEERGMFSKDSSNSITRRFGGVEFVPSSVLVRGFGERQQTLGAVLENEAKFNDFVPLIYGTAWYQPPIVLARNDGNLTRMEVLLGMGEMQSVLKVIVNGVEIPVGKQGLNMTATGWFNIVSFGNRTGNFNLDFSDSTGVPLGDPYGSMAFLSVVVPNRISDGRALPSVKVLVKGMKLDSFQEDGTFVATNFTNNPSWILLDLLRRSGWDLEELDIASFYRSAVGCDQPINTKDLNGNEVSIPRRQCNLVVRKRRSAAELIRGIRNCAGLFLTFAVDGKLSLKQETTLAEQQPAKPEGSNSIEELFGGWPAYEFGDGTNGFSGIISKESGEPSISLSSRSTADTPNRFSVEFQDAFNEYQQDSLSIVDINDVRRAGQETSASLPALGFPNFAQAARLTTLQLRKSVRGNKFADFETSVKGFYLRPGDIITITYLREGFDRSPFRIVSVAPGLNYRTIRISARIHDDAWYIESAGDGSGSIGRQPSYELGLPRPLLGTVLNPDGSSDFGIVERSSITADGGGATNLEVSFAEPRRVVASSAGIPMLALAPSLDSIGGTIKGDQVLYYALTAVDAGGSESSLSFVVRAEIPPGTDANKVTLTGISLNSKTDSFNVYRGVTPQTLLRIATSLPPATSFSDSGATALLVSPPDENFSSAHFYWRLELEPEHTTNLFGASIIGNDTAFWANNAFQTKLVRITAGKGARQERLIASNTPTTITVIGTWSIQPDASSIFVVAEPSWVAGAIAATSPVVFEVPNRQGTTIQVSGRSANVNGRESAYELSPITRWQMGGAAGSALDTAEPPEPDFGLTTNGAGQVFLSAVAFTTLVNTHSIQSGTLTTYYWDELENGTELELAEELITSATILKLSQANALGVGVVVQIGDELLQIEEQLVGGFQYRVSRGQFGSTPSTHSLPAFVYPLQQKVYIVPFARNFFGSPGSGNFAYSLDLPNSRISAASLFVTNSVGNSPLGVQSYTGSTDFGLRTLSGGQITLQVDGFLSIENDAVPPIRIESKSSIRDIYAMVNDAATGAAIVTRVRQDAITLATLTIPIGKTISNIVNGFGKPPLDPTKRLSLDIVSVGSAVDTTPGADLTVTVRF